MNSLYLLSCSQRGQRSFQLQLLFLGWFTLLSSEYLIGCFGIFLFWGLSDTLLILPAQMLHRCYRADFAFGGDLSASAYILELLALLRCPVLLWMLSIGLEFCLLVALYSESECLENYIAPAFVIFPKSYPLHSCFQNIFLSPVSRFFFLPPSSFWGDQRAMIFLMSYYSNRF